MRANRKSDSNNLSSVLAFVGIAALVIGLILMLALSQIVIAAWAVIGIGIVLLIVAFIIDYRRVSKAVTGRRGRFGVGNTMLACVFIGIVIVANSISVAKYARIDTSALEQFTLTPQTIQVLKDLKTPVKVIGFLVPEKDSLHINDYLQSLIATYENYTNDISFQVIDPDKHPDQAKKYNITEYSTLVFVSGDRQCLVPPSEYTVTDSSGNVTGLEAEHAFTSAILEVTGVAQKKVYFLTGDGEEDINQSYSDVKNGLLNDLYQVDTLNLLTSPQVPADCAALIIAAPQNPLTKDEIVIIESYLLNGGDVFILTNPGGNPDLETIVKPWGVDIGNGTIIDPSSSLAPHQDIPIVPASRDYFMLPSVYFPGATAIIPQPNPPSGVGINPLVWTDASSWLDKNYSAGSTPTFDSQTETMQPQRIGVLIAWQSPSGNYARLAIMGDSDFVSNDSYNDANNADLFLNTVNWLSADTSLISIRRIVQPFRSLVVTQGQTIFIEYSSITLLPVILLIIAGVIWWRRR